MADPVWLSRACVLDRAAIVDCYVVTSRGGSSTMQWLRVKRTWFGAFALFALALQLAVSFAHVHVARVQAGAFAVASLTAPAADADYPPATVTCDICATLQLGGVAQLAHPPALVLPLFAAVEMPSVAARILPARRYSLAQSRAPPRA